MIAFSLGRLSATMPFASPAKTITKAATTMQRTKTRVMMKMKAKYLQTAMLKRCVCVSCGPNSLKVLTGVLEWQIEYLIERLSALEAERRKTQEYVNKVEVRFVWSIKINNQFRRVYVKLSVVKTN